jgi:phosphoribosylanthranilate isomerase
MPWILAGGIQPENVSQALQFLRPDAIDVASGVEEAPGIKSAKKMAALMDQVQKKSH